MREVASYDPLRMSFFGTPLGAAIIGALAIVVGLFVFGQVLGWITEPNALAYVLGAIAGLVGGYVGGMRRQQRRKIP